MMLGKNQRKIFYGNNLFAKGACYSAIEKAKKAKLNNVIYLGNDFIRKNIGMELIVGSKLSYYSLIKSGIHWFEAEASCEIIVNGADKLVFSVSSMENGKKTDFAMILDDMPKRPPKTTRLKVTLRFEERDICEVTVEDMGFGEMFPSSGKIWHDYL